jgi:hypothetical protein
MLLRNDAAPQADAKRPCNATLQAKPDCGQQRDVVVGSRATVHLYLCW